MQYERANSLVKKGKSIFRESWGDYKYLLQCSDDTIYLFQTNDHGGLVRTPWKPTKEEKEAKDWKQSYFNREI